MDFFGGGRMEVRMKGEVLAALLAGVLFGLLLVVIMLYVTSKNRSIKSVYDERQERVRGKGFQYGFFALLIYNFFYGALDMVFEERFVDSMAGAFPGIALGVIVYASYCIWKEGYISLNEHPTRLILLMAFIGVVNLIIGIGQIRNKELVVDGVLTYRCMNLVCAIMSLVIVVQLLFKRILDARRDREEGADDD